jgi:hypothetical protein
LKKLVDILAEMSKIRICRAGKGRLQRAARKKRGGEKKPLTNSGDLDKVNLALRGPNQQGGAAIGRAIFEN